MELLFRCLKWVGGQWGCFRVEARERSYKIAFRLCSTQLEQFHCELCAKSNSTRQMFRVASTSF